MIDEMQEELEGKAKELEEMCIRDSGNTSGGVGACIYNTDGVPPP